MIVHLIDGTYELFRHFYGIRRFKKTDPPFGAVSGVLHMVAKMIEDGATLQLGIGSIPDQVLKNLVDHKSLGLHTEMLSDGVIPLIQKGGKIRLLIPSGYAYGSQAQTQIPGNSILDFTIELIDVL